MKLEEAVQSLVENFKPYSIFLYGSKATGTDNKNSDYELGVIFEDNKYVSRRDIADRIKIENFAIYPFKLSEILHCDIDTPFQKSIYLNVLIGGGSKTLYGVSVLQNLKKPAITKEDLLANINFNLGVAFSAFRTYKAGNVSLANDLFYKSCFYATRDLIYYRFGKLCLSYNEIYEFTKQMQELNTYRELLNAAHNLRNYDNKAIDASLYYKNISYINKFILKEL